MVPSLARANRPKLVFRAHNQLARRYRRRRHQRLAHFVLPQYFELLAGLYYEYVAVFTWQVDFAVRRHRRRAETRSLVRDPLPVHLFARLENIAIQDARVAEDIKVVAVDQG